MRVDAGPGASQHFAQGNINRQTHTKTKTAKAESAAPRIESDTKAEQAGATSERGVIRKLQEGHFKGVADVRLRTIFHAELQAAENKNGLRAVHQTANQITEAVSSQFESLVDLAKLDSEKQEAAKQVYADFENSVAKILSNSTDPQAAIADLRSTVDTFLSSFKRLFAAEPGSPTNNPSGGHSTEITEITGEGYSVIDAASLEGETDAPVNQNTIQESVEVTNGDPPGKLDLFIQAFNDLATKIDGMFTDLKSSLTKSSSYEPVPPRGNGVAFEKFLAIYREMDNSAVLAGSEPVKVPTTPESESQA